MEDVVWRIGAFGCLLLQTFLFIIIFFIAVLAYFISLFACNVVEWICNKYVNKRPRIFLSLSKLECGLQEINFREMRLQWNLQRIGINATTFEKTRMPFQVACEQAFGRGYTVAVVDARARNVRSLCSWRDDWQDGICFLGGEAARDFHEGRSLEIPNLLVAPPSKQYSTRKTIIALTR